MKSIIKGIRSKIIYLLKRFYFLLKIKSYSNFLLNEVKIEKKNFEKSGGCLKKLTKSQKQEIYELWGKVDVSTHELLYSITNNFTPNYCPLVHFRTKIEYELNEPTLVRAWSDKNYYNKFFPNIPFPVSLVHNINGVFFDENYREIDLNQAIKITRSEEYVIIKPSLDSYCGKGVEKFNSSDDFNDIFKKYNKNFIVQKILKQYKPLSDLNPSSVNVIRYNSLNLNGTVYPLSATLRCGAEGAINDNSITEDGKGMVLIGVEFDGHLKDKAYYSCGECLHVMPNGVHFKDLVIPNFDKVVHMIKEMHSLMPQFGFIGFDVAFNEDGNPVIMEYNVNVPGVLYYQYTDGPLFGSLTEKIAKKFKS